MEEFWQLLFAGYMFRISSFDEKFKERALKIVKFISF